MQIFSSVDMFMRCQILCSEKKKIYITDLSSAELAKKW